MPDRYGRPTREEMAEYYQVMSYMRSSKYKRARAFVSHNKKLYDDEIRKMKKKPNSKYGWLW